MNVIQLCPHLADGRRSISVAPIEPTKFQPQAVNEPASAQGAGLHDLFFASKARAPAHPALIGADASGKPAVTLSYSEVAERAWQLARHLRRLGMASGDRVAMKLPRGIEAIIAEIAILAAGGTFVPIDFAAPAERVAYIVADVRAKLLLGVSDEHAALVQAPVLNLRRAAAAIAAEATEPFTVVGPQPSDLAYIIYTSGTSGRPKGVMVSHSNARHFVNAEGQVLAIQGSDIVFQGFSYAFDMSIEEIWPALAAGATLFVASEELAGSGPDIAVAIEQGGVTVLHAVPSLVSMIDRELPAVRLLNVGGEACPPELVRRWARPGRRMINTYGPTEATVSATFAELSPNEPVTIGRPLPGYEVCIVDADLAVITNDRPGELCIAGAGVSAGYVNRPELTADKFRLLDVAADGNVRLVYRTGDLVRRSNNGDLIFLGRIDSQVKIRGYRVELSEIENLILEDRSVRATAVSTHEAGPLDQILVAYLVPRDGAIVDVAAIRTRLAVALPKYMIPAAFEILASLPALPSGKVDRARLPPPASLRSTGDAVLIAAATLAEREVAVDCAAVLKQAAVSVEADFFDELGGHSLLAAQFVSRLRDNPRYAHVSMGDVYGCRTVRRLAALLDETRPASLKAARPFRPISPWRYALCATAQLAVIIVEIGVATAMTLAPYFIYLVARSSGFSVVQAVLASLGVVLGVGLVGFAVPPAVKRAVGPFAPGSYPMWGATYFRWWLFRRSLAFAPLGLLVGTPLIAAYWRLLGARIGCGTLIGAAAFDAPDLIAIGDGATIGGNSVLNTADVGGGEFHLGRVSVDRHATIGIACIVGRGAHVGANAILEDLSMVPDGVAIGDGERWSGSPARRVPSVAPEGHTEMVKPASPFAATAFAVAGLALIPLSFGPVLAGIGVATLVGATRSFGDFLLSTPLIALVYVLTTMALVVAVKWTVLGKVEPRQAPYWSLFHLRLWIAQSVSGSALASLHPLYGTLYLRPFYRCLGMRFGKGTEMTTASGLVHDLVSVGERSFVADAAVLGAPHFERGTVSITQTSIGNKSFVGNGALIPSGSRLADNALIGVLSRPPVRPAEQARMGATWFGSPAIFFPQREKITCFGSALTFEPPAALVAQRLAIEAVRIIMPVTVIAVLSILSVKLLIDAVAAGCSIPMLAALAVGVGLAFGAAALLYAVALKWTLMGRYRSRMAPLWSRFVWLTELVTTNYEFVAVPHFLSHLCGTPFLAACLRLLGVRIGRRVFLDTTDFTEFDLVSMGDDVAFNRNSGAQTHLFEDRVMKLSRSDIGARATIGAYSTTLYDTRIGEDAALGALSILMKGEELPPGTTWEGSPARPAPVDDPGVIAPEPIAA